MVPALQTRTGRVSDGLGFAFLIQLLLSVSMSPCQSGIPPNITDVNLGDAESPLSVDIVQAPYFVGERVVLRATVRNVTGKPVRLPRPDAIFVTVSKDPFDTPLRHGRGHQCNHGLGSIDNESLGKKACLDWIDKRSSLFAPGESRSATWVSDTVGQHPLDMHGHSPVSFAVQMDCHDRLPERWFRVRVRLFRDPIRGQLLRQPERRYQRFFFIHEASPGQFMVLSTTGWYDTLDARALS